MSFHRVKVSISRKHPNGAVWIESGFGWAHVDNVDVRSVLGLNDGVRFITGDLVVSEQIYDELTAHKTFEDVLQQGGACEDCRG